MEGKSSEELRGEEEWWDCWICKRFFGRRRQTNRYCYACGRGFCEGEYGHFPKGKVGFCIICRAK